MSVRIVGLSYQSLKRRPSCKTVVMNNLKQVVVAFLFVKLYFILANVQEVALMVVSITLSLGLIPVPDDAERQRGCTPRLMIATKSLVV